MPREPVILQNIFLGIGLFRGAFATFTHLFTIGMKRLVIFDLDGTLLNTIDDLAASANYALAQCGYPLHDVCEYPMFVGNGISKLLERALPAEARCEAVMQRMREVFLQYYDSHNAVYTRPYEGIVALLEELQRRGVMLAVASNKYQSATEALMAHYFPSIRFVAVLGQRDSVPVKPHPAIVHDIFSIAGVAANEVLYVGDSDVDMLTAAAAGVTSVGVTWGFRSEVELRSAGASHIIGRAEELTGLLG